MPLRLYTFSKNNSHVPDNTSDKFGIRGSLLLKLSELELPIAPGFIIDAETFRNIHNEDIISLIKEGVSFIEKISYKDYNQGSVPLTLKIVLSPSIDIEVLSSIHNIGINQNTLEAFSSIGGADFAYGEYRYLLQSVVHHFTDLAEIPEVKQEKNDQTACEKYLAALDGLFPKDGYEQIAFLLKKYHERYFSDSLNQNIPCAVFVQMMVYGKFGNNSYNGEYFTRDINTGDNTINGFFGVGEMFTDRKHGKDLSKIDAVYYDEFKRIGHIIERHFIDVKYIRFTIERGVLWIVSIFNADQISTRSQVKMLLDMHREGVIDDNYIVSKIVPNQLNDLLHSSVDEDSKADFKSVTGGIAGSPGACIGRVYFSTKKLMDAYRDSLARGEDSRFILAMAATYAGDVQAIEIGQGVISSEGGFASHAPVVARSIGKPAIVNSDIEFTDTSMVINEVTVKEGEYITMEVNNYSDPVIYFGQVKLQSPDLENNLIFDLMKIINKYVDKFYVRANADNQKEAALAKKLGARGVGLCRTEHMFFNENRINIFREVLLTEDGEKIQKVLNELKKFQVDDFVDLFEAMEGLPITIRLLDAPLHEFIPQTIEQRELFNQSYVKRGGKHNPLEIKIIFDRLKEVNPMLGHRGCRIAVSFFDLYKMQIEAIFEAAYQCHRKNIAVFPEILIPMVMTDEELKYIIYGKVTEEINVIGLVGIEQEFLKKNKLTKMPFKYIVGSMIELPAAAIGAADLAKHVSFFSYGTNDLTQTTNGISRDDINSFLPSYTMFDIFKDNPFQILTDPVKSLIAYSALSGRLTRPDLKLGLCGEHGANEENIKFCIANGLNYVSCSTYSVPMALLSVVRHQLGK